MTNEEPITNENNHEEFSSLDIHFIRASLSSRTDEEIAEILDKPVEKIRSKINDITGAAGQRQTEMKERKLREMQAESVNRNVQRKRAELRAEMLDNQEKKKKSKKVEQDHRNRDHRAQLKRQESAMTRKYKTRSIDFSKLTSVKIDHKTFILVEPGLDIDKVKQQYQTIRKQQANGTHNLED